MDEQVVWRAIAVLKCKMSAETKTTGIHFTARTMAATCRALRAPNSLKATRSMGTVDSAMPFFWGPVGVFFFLNKKEVSGCCEHRGKNRSTAAL